MIVFFDGVCGLCNGAVDFLIARDKDARLQFAPLQGTTAFTQLPATDTQNLNSLVVMDGKTIHRKSDGVLLAVSELGPGWRTLATVARIVPTFARDLVYDVVAKNRYVVFGQRESCRLPTADERTRFLD